MTGVSGAATRKVQTVADYLARPEHEGLELIRGTIIEKAEVNGEHALTRYRRERMPEPPKGRPLALTPDWVCEILSPSNPQRDRVEKLPTYFEARVPHYWIIDPVAGSLEVFRRLDLAYALVLVALRGQRARAEPFEALELKVAELLGADPEE